MVFLLNHHHPSFVNISIVFPSRPPYNYGKLTGESYFPVWRHHEVNDKNDRQPDRHQRVDRGLQFVGRRKRQ